MGKADFGLFYVSLSYVYIYTRAFEFGRNNAL